MTELLWFFTHHDGSAAGWMSSWGTRGGLVGHCVAGRAGAFPDLYKIADIS